MPIVFGLAVLAFFVAISLSSLSQLKGRFFRRRIRKLLGKPLDEVTVIQTELLAVDLPNFHRGVDAWSKEGDLEIIARRGHPNSFGLFDNIRDAKLTPQAIRFQMMRVGPKKRVRVPIQVLVLARFKDRGLLIWNEQRAIMVACADESLAEKALERIGEVSRINNCYRGQVLSVMMEPDYDYGNTNVGLEFHEVDSVDEANIILPPEIFGLLKRSTLDFFRVADRLVEMGQPGSRGLLLHGPPGTGKTLVSRWLIGHLPDVTKFLVTGQQLLNLERKVRMARMLRPSLLILDDVDLVASHRESNPYSSVLHDLMNLMDGLDRQDQVMFLLTTNRPDAIESALSDRPGRVDQAIQFPLPDAECRLRLIKLFAGEQSLQQFNLDRWVRDSESTTPAFLRELVRRGTQCAIVRSEDSAAEIQISDTDLQVALRDMTSGSGSLTRRLLGFGSQPHFESDDTMD